MYIRTFEKKLEEKLSKFFLHHPQEAFLFSLIILPIGVVFAVGFFTALCAIPVSLLLGRF